MKDGRYKKGHIPWNKGVAFDSGGRSHSTRFKKGRISEKRKPIGSERIGKDNYVYIKAENPSRWIPKQRYIYEQHYGEIPKNHVILFNDGDKRNFAINNLLLVSRKQLAVINKLKLQQNTKEMNESALLIVDLIMKINEKEKVIL